MKYSVRNLKQCFNLKLKLQILLLNRVPAAAVPSGGRESAARVAAAGRDGRSRRTRSPWPKGPLRSRSSCASLPVRLPVPVSPELLGPSPRLYTAQSLPSSLETVSLWHLVFVRRLLVGLGLGSGTCSCVVSCSCWLRRQLVVDLSLEMRC